MRRTHVQAIDKDGQGAHVRKGETGHMCTPKVSERGLTCTLWMRVEKKNMWTQRVGSGGVHM